MLKLPNMQLVDRAVEVLEHIKDDDRAAAELRAAAGSAVFVLVPFADAATNANAARRERVLANYGHHRIGYDAERLAALFPGVETLRGCYWEAAGAAFLAKLGDLDDEGILGALESLQEEAAADLRATAPSVYPAAQGVWVVG